MLMFVFMGLPFGGGCEISIINPAGNPTIYAPKLAPALANTAQAATKSVAEQGTA